MAKAKPKFNKVDILAIMDRSGSMAGLWKEEISGLNKFVEDQAKEPGEAAFTLVHFDNEYAVHFDRVPIKDVKPLTGNEFPPRGYTALLDAIGRTITEHDARLDKADHTIVMITTDGAENASKEYTKDKIKALITEKEKTGKYTFIFLGANIDAFGTASGLGIAASNATNYDPNAGGTFAKYAAVSSSSASVRSTGGMGMTLNQAYNRSLSNVASVLSTTK